MSAPSSLDTGQGLGASATQTGLSPTVEPASGLAGSAASIPSADEDFLAQLRRVNTARYDVWATQPLMLCEHCGRDVNSAAGSGHNFCVAPFDQREHSFTKPHPYITVSNDAGIMFDALELGGEVGELLNVVKKLEREDRGWRGSRASSDDFADECADVLICLDKLARRRGVDLAAATVRKFNATSDKVGLPHKLAASAIEARQGGDPQGLHAQHESAVAKPDAQKGGVA